MSTLRRDWPPLAERINTSLPKGTDPLVAQWMGLVAKAAQMNLDADDALPHRAFVELIAEARGFDSTEQHTIGDAFDHLQLAIELADDVADWDDDVERERPHVQLLSQIPAGARPALPIASTLACAACVAKIGGDRIALTLSKMTAIGSRMVVGQGRDDEEGQIALASGEQALLLGLPMWLDSATTAHEQQEFDTWARAWGLTWELAQRVKERRARPSQLANAMERCRELWPDIVPFRRGEALAMATLMPSGMS